MSYPSQPENLQPSQKLHSRWSVPSPQHCLFPAVTHSPPVGLHKQTLVAVTGDVLQHGITVLSDMGALLSFESLPSHSCPKGTRTFIFGVMGNG